MGYRRGKHLSQGGSIDYPLKEQVNRIIRKMENRIISWPRTEAEQSGVNALMKRSMNRVVSVPRADHGEFALLEKTRRLVANAVVRFPVQDHGEFALLEKTRKYRAYSAADCANIADGSTAGKIKSQAACGFKIAEQLYLKAATDDLWDLSALVDTGGAVYVAVCLWLDAAGTASIDRLTDAASEAAALAFVPAALAASTTKSLIGVYVAAPSTDFDGGAGLDSFGTYYNGIPAACWPAAVTAEAETLIADGSTPGKFKLSERIAYTNDGLPYYKAATDDLWDLTGIANNGGAEYAGHLLVIDGGTASVLSTAKVASSAAALTAMIALIPTGKAIVGAFVSGLSCDFSSALTAQGTLYQGLPEACIPAAVTAETETLIADGITNGKFKLSERIGYLNDGAIYWKAATDDLWDLTGVTNNGAAEYAAHLLCIDGGTASVISTAKAASANAAIALASAAVVAGKAVVGVFVSGLSCNFSAALTAQGTLYQWSPEGMTPTEATVESSTLLADGGTAGYVKLVNAIQFMVDGQRYSKAATDDLWNLSAEVDTTSVQYRAYMLCLNAAGTASVVTGANAASAAAAVVAAEKSVPASKVVVGWYVADPSTDFNNVAGLDSYGTYYDGSHASATIYEILGSW